MNIIPNLYFANIMSPEVWIIVLVVILVMFGGKKIPELMRGVGRGMGELQKGIHEGKQHIEQATRLDATHPYEPPEGETLPRQETDKTKTV